MMHYTVLAIRDSYLPTIFYHFHICSPALTLSVLYRFTQFYADYVQACEIIFKFLSYILGLQSVSRDVADNISATHAGWIQQWN